MKIFISLHQYARFIFGGVIAPFHLEYFIEMLYVQLIQHYKWFACMLACYHIYIQSRIIMPILSYNFLWSYCPFQAFEIFGKENNCEGRGWGCAKNKL
jgi:hypothetical protein